MKKTKEDVKVLVASYGKAIDENTLIFRNGPDFRKGFIHSVYTKTDTKKGFRASALKLNEVYKKNGVNNINISALSAVIQRCVKDLKSKTTKPDRDWNSIVDFLETEIVVPLDKPEPQDEVMEVDESMEVAMEEEVNKTDLSVQEQGAPAEETARSESMYCARPNCLLNTSKLIKRNRGLQSKVKFFRNLSNVAQKEDLTYENRKLKQAISRKVTVETSLRQDRRKLKTIEVDLRKKIANLESTDKAVDVNYLRTESANLKRSRSKINIEKSKLKNKVINLTKDKTLLEKKNSALVLEVDGLKCELDEIHGSCDSKVIFAKDNLKTYSVNFRKAAYSCLESQVPVETIGTVLKSVIKNLTGATLDTIPEPSTFSQMAYEMGVLSDIQVAEEMLTHDNLTLSMDATSLDGDHVNEVHVNLPSTPPRGLILQIAVLGGGATGDYVEHIKESINDVTLSYAKCFEKNHIELKELVISHMKNTITDRVAVNHCVVEQLIKDFDHSILELNCNLHPLDGIAGRARSVLKDCDIKFKIVSATFGQACKAANLIYGVSKMRYKQGKGDPSAFKLFIKSHNIRSGQFVRYVGNRLHVLFHLAGVVYFYTEQLIVFLGKDSGTARKLKKALKADLENIHLVVQLRSLGLLGKYLTAPWMRLFYQNSENKTNLEMGEPLRTAVANLKRMETNPLCILTTTTDAFNRPLLDDDEIRVNLQQDALQSEMELAETLAALASGSVKVLEKQLKSYLDGKLSRPTLVMLEQTVSAPLHNIFAEQTLGLTDHQFRRAPNANMGFIDGKVRCRKNNTLSWLETKPSDVQQHLIKFALGHAAKLRKIRKERAAVIEKKKRQRLADIERKAVQKQRKGLEKDLEKVVSGTAKIVDLFPTISATRQKLVEDLVENPNSIVDKYIRHIWEEDDDNENNMYHGNVIKYKVYAKLGPCYTISYWELDGNESEDNEDVKLKLTETVFDIVNGDFELA